MLEKNLEGNFIDSFIAHNKTGDINLFGRSQKMSDIQKKEKTNNDKIVVS